MLDVHPTLSYKEKFPIGVQTVVADRIAHHWQANTRTVEGWWISKNIITGDVRDELIKQALRFETTYQIKVDRRYIRRFLLRQDYDN